jgi:hypothetical protein
MKEEAQMKKILLTFFMVLTLLLVSADFSVQASTVPTFSIQGVTEGEKVTIKTYNFPANREFVARMGVIGTKGINGIVVGSVNSGTGGSLIITFDIPLELSNYDLIAIRLDSTTGGYYAFNWFTNTNFGTHEGGTPIEGETTPSIVVTSVKKDTLVVVKGRNFPLDETIRVLMGEKGTKGIDGVLVTTFELETDTDFIEEFDIPASLASKSELSIRFESTDSDLAVFMDFMNTTGSIGGISDGSSYSGIPTFSILSVVEDEEVTIRTYNFPAGKDFKVLMGEMGTKGVGGIQVTTINSGVGGSFEETFEIPAALAGEYQIAIRLETPDGYYYAYNWFYNNTTNGGSVPDGYTGIPTFSITDVVADDTVTIKTSNFPAGYDFKVLMGEMGTKGVGGILVTTINSGSGGSFSQTFDIPAALAGDYQIAIRLEATTGGFFAYNWFYNNTTNGSDGADGYAGIPTFSITGVVEDSSVTIKTNNFPAGYDFKVLMGKMWTQGIGGIHVTTINSGSGGSFSKMFNIPASLAGEDRISIRLEATTGGFFAYNWFYNNTYP